MPNSDIFKSNFLNNLNAVTLTDMAIAIILSFLAGLFILAIYRKTFRGVTYSSSFGFTLIGLTMITTVLMLAVTSNVMLSLGMVGALSIVRFRTAIKDPMEIAFLFWSIETGIVLAAGIFPLALAGNTAIGVFFLLIGRFRTGRRTFLLVLRCDGWAELDQAEEKARNSEGVLHMTLKGMTPRPMKIEESGKTREAMTVEADWEITFRSDGKSNGHSAVGSDPNASKEAGDRDRHSGSPEARLLQALHDEMKGVRASLVGTNGTYTV